MLVEGEISPEDPLWEGTDIALSEPLRVDLRAQPVGDGILVRGRMQARLALECRRCLVQVPTEIDDTVDLLYESLDDVDEDDLSGEVYPIPDRGTELDLGPALREQLLLRVPRFVVCDQACRGLCPQCGTDLNQGTCDCVPDTGGSPWDALKKLKLD